MSEHKDAPIDEKCDGCGNLMIDCTCEDTGTYDDHLAEIDRP